MEKQLFIGGFGGQGVMLIAKMLGKASASEGRDCTFFPEYEPAMRGGSSFATVITSDEPVHSVVLPSVEYMCVLDNRTFQQQMHRVRRGGIVLINSDLISEKYNNDDVKSVYVPMISIAEELGNERLQNVVMLGAIWAVTHMCGKEALIKEIEKTFAGKEHLIELNKKAFERGSETAASQL